MVTTVDVLLSQSIWIKELPAQPDQHVALRASFRLETATEVDLRSLGRNGEGRTIETFRLRLRGGAKVDVHFDITSFHQL